MKCSSFIIAFFAGPFTKKVTKDKIQVGFICSNFMISKKFMIGWILYCLVVPITGVITPNESPITVFMSVQLLIGLCLLLLSTANQVKIIKTDEEDFDKLSIDDLVELKKFTSKLEGNRRFDVYVDNAIEKKAAVL